MELPWQDFFTFFQMPFIPSVFQRQQISKPNIITSRPKNIILVSSSQNTYQCLSESAFKNKCYLDHTSVSGSVHKGGRGWRYQYSCPAGWRYPWFLYWDVTWVLRCELGPLRLPSSHCLYIRACSDSSQEQGFK